MRASILINNYNYGQFIGAAIKSALDQDYDDCEIIVYDDGSTDNSVTEANHFSSKVEVVSKRNHGLSPCFNQANAIYQAFLKSKGEVIFLLDSDDLFYKNKVSKVIHQFEKEPCLVMVQHNFNKIDPNGNIIKRNFKPTLPIASHLKYIQFTQRMEYLFMQTSALAFKRPFLEAILPIHEDPFNLVWADVRLTRESLAYGKVKMIEESLGAYRVHGKNDSGKLVEKKIRQQFQKQHYAWFNTKRIAKKNIHRPEGKIMILLSIIKSVLYLTFNDFRIKKKFKFISTVLKSRKEI